MQSSSMRNIGAKNFGFNIELIKWSNRMDLIAFSNNKNEVIVQRLNWQNLWIHSPPAENVKVRGIDWRPDERILAIGYSNGLVTLIDVENQHEIHKINLDWEITSLAWTQNTTEFQDGTDDAQDNRMFQDSHEIYLPPLPSFHTLSSNARKTDYNSTKSYCTKVFNILLVGLRSGNVHMFVFGVLSCGKIDVAKYLNTTPDKMEIVDVRMSTDFRTVFVFVKHERVLKELVFENDIFAKYMHPLLRLAAKHGHILSTMNYIEDIIQCITEAWESALLEMDNKLTKYANSRPNGMVSAEFLELLMFGYSSTQLEQFLRCDLTEKGLKRLGNSIEISYSTIQQLVVKPLHTGILNICFHLNCIKGMSANTYSYKQILGTISREASQNAGAFLIKSLELQQAIEQSTRDYKIFWGWLYGVIIKFLEDNVPEEVAAVSQQDITYLAEFLNTFDHDESGKACSVNKRKFNLERVGQYLKNENLPTHSLHDPTSEWSKLLDENECLKASDIIYPHHKELSLVQEHNLLKKSITELFSKPEKHIGDQFSFKMCMDIMAIGDDNSSIQVDHINVDSKKPSSLFTVNASNKTVYFIEYTTKSDFVKLIKLEFSEMPFLNPKLQNYSSLRLCHLQFYNESTISMLIAASSRDLDYDTKLFVQFPIQKIQPRLLGLKLTEHIDITQLATSLNLYEMLDTSSLRTLEVHDGHMISVSGSRKIASVLSESRKRLRHYEMEVEDDDDENDISQNNESLDVSGGQLN